MEKPTRDESDPRKTDGAAASDMPVSGEALPEHAARALEKLRRVDAQLAARYERTRVERRKRSR